MTTLLEMRQAVENAKQTLKAHDDTVYDMALLLKGRLRKVGSKWLLSKLKRELHDFNAVTGTWKEEK